jgi:hypothetical protein
VPVPDGSDYFSSLPRDVFFRLLEGLNPDGLRLNNKTIDTTSDGFDGQ